MQGQVWFSKTAVGHRNGLKISIYGSKGSIHWVQENPEQLEVFSSNGKKKIIDRGSSLIIAGKNRYNRFKAGHPAGFIEAMANLYYDFHSSLLSWRNERRNNSQEVFGVELALEGLKWFEAMQRSIESQKWEDLD